MGALHNLEVDIYFAVDDNFYGVVIWNGLELTIEFDSRFLEERCPKPVPVSLFPRLFIPILSLANLPSPDPNT